MSIPWPCASSMSRLLTSLATPKEGAGGGRGKGLGANVVDNGGILGLAGLGLGSSLTLRGGTTCSGIEGDGILLAVADFSPGPEELETKRMKKRCSTGEFMYVNLRTNLSEKNTFKLDTHLYIATFLDKGRSIRVSWDVTRRVCSVTPQRQTTGDPSMHELKVGSPQPQFSDTRGMSLATS